MLRDDQDAVRDFLADPHTHDGQRVETMETHISEIFLAGDRVFKLKRSVKLPYVDFSTPEIRLETCRKEVEYNAAGAPGLYLGIRKITHRDEGELEFDGTGPLVDAVVEMRRFDQADLLDRMAADGRLDDRIMRDTADRIAEFHRSRDPVHTMTGSENVAGVLAINEAGFAEGALFDKVEIDALNAAFRMGLSRHAARLDRREREGHIRRCHGDLHLRNICLIEGEPRLFDCIEFNDQIAICDTLYDLAFLIMDLWHRGLESQANLVANRYLDRTGDDEGYALLPYFMAMRAAVRAHVTATQIAEADEEDSDLAHEARAYFKLARSLLEERQGPVIVIGGLSGSGKTTVAETLAPRLGAPPGARILETDRIRKALFDVAPETTLPSAAYTPEVSAKVYGMLTEKAVALQRTGMGVIVEGVFDREDLRHAIGAALAEADPPAAFFWLSLAAERLKERVQNRPQGVSDADSAVLERQLAGFETPASWIKVDADGPAGEIAETIRAATKGRPQPVAARRSDKRE